MRGSSRGRWFFLALLALAAILPATAAAQEAPGAPQREEAQVLDELRDEDARVLRHSETGEVRFVGATKANPVDRPAGLSPDAPTETAARAHLDEIDQLFGIENQARELRVEESEDVGQGRATTEFQQVYKGVPVLGGEINAEVDANNNLLVATGEVSPHISLDIEPGISADEAREQALGKIARERDLEAGDLEASEPRLWIYDPALLGGPGIQVPRLVWRMDVTLAEGVVDFKELVLVDAGTGEVALNFDQVPHTRNRLTYTAENKKTLPGTLVCDEADSNCAGGDADAMNAHVFARDAYDFYSNNHGRDSMDGAGMTMTSSVHFDTNYQNANWNGQQMFYGDGWAVDDVVAHEFTHGVTQYESGLFYYYQSGAINESLSDIWGEFVDLGNGAGTDTDGTRWQVGEDIPDRPPLRDMEEPPTFKHPDRMSSPLYTADADETDVGGVHTNSGVNNKAAYLLTDGGTFPAVNGRTVTGLGVTKVAKIYYEVQTNLLTSASDYADLHTLLQQACANLTGTSGITAADCQEVKDAVYATEMHREPPNAPAPEAPGCKHGVGKSLFSDDMENTSSGNWSFQSPWAYGTSYASSGDSHLYGPTTKRDYSSSGEDGVYSVTQAGAVGIPLNPIRTYMRFRHAYDFLVDPNTNFDGGVLEYSTDNGASWNDAGSLFTDNGYNGTIESNPLYLRDGFVDKSNGYISSRVDLSSLAGQTVKFRFRISKSFTTGDLGWFIDDVSFYTCETPSFIAFFHGPGNEIYAMDPTGANQTNLTNHSRIDQDPAISPDGQKIAFVSDRSLTGGNIYVMNADGSGLQRLTNVSDGYFDPAFSPDGSKIVFARGFIAADSEIWVMNADGSGLRNLTNNSAVDEYLPVFSPDGTKIAFTSNRNGEDVWVMNADGSNQTNLTTDNPGGLADSTPAFSPDGSKIAFTRGLGDGAEIYAMNAADGSGKVNLTRTHGEEYEPAFSPDGSKIVFGSRRAGNPEIFSMNADGTGQTRLTNNSVNDFDPAWGRIAIPGNDDFGGAQTLSGDSQAGIQADGTNVGASKEPGEPHHADEPGGKSVWYKWVSQNIGETATISTTGNTTFDTMLGVYTGTAVNRLTEVASNDNASDTTSLSSVSFRAIRDTTYWIAVDGKGSADGDFELDLVSRDITAPFPPLIESPPDVDFSYDTDGNITISGRAEQNSTVELFDGDTSKGTTTADADHTWSMALTGVSEGLHDYTAKATDAAGNTSEASNTVTVFVDTAKPTVTIETPEDGARYETGRTVRAGYSCADEQGGSGLKSCEGTVNDGDPIDTSTAGPRSFTVTAKDNAGNEHSVAVTYEVVAPPEGGEAVGEPVGAGETVTTDHENDGATASDPIETSVTSPVAGDVSITEQPTTGQPPSGFSFLGQQVNITAPEATAQNPLKLAFTLDASQVPQGQNQDTIQVFRNGTKAEDCADSSGVASPDPCVLESEALGGGDVRFTVLTSRASVWNFGVANSAPETRPDTYDVNQDGVLSVNAPGVLGNDTDPENNTLTAIKVSDPSNGTLTLNSNGSFTYTPNAGFTGTDTFTYRANDGAADSNTATVTITIRDAIPPAAPSTPNLTAASDSGSSSTDNVTNDATPTFTGTAEAGATVTIFDGTAQIGSATAKSSGSYNITTDPLAEGDHDISATATDAANNTGPPSEALRVKIDTSQPELPGAPVHSLLSPSQLSSSTLPGTIPVKLAWSAATDNTGGSGRANYHLQQSTNGGAFAEVGEPSEITFTRELVPGTDTYRFRVSATDKAGNQSNFRLGTSFRLRAFQESSAAIVDTGSWTTAAINGAYGSSVQHASVAGRKATFSVAANTKNVSLVSTRASNRGKARVCVDPGTAAQSCTTVDLFSAVAQPRSVVFSKALDPATSHKLEVTVLGQKNASSTGTRVDADAFVTTS